MATRSEVAIKTGIDNSAIGGGMRELQAKVNAGTKGIGDTFKKLRAGFVLGGALNIFGIVDSITDMALEFYKRSSELGKFWGTFIAGGEQAVMTMGDAEAAAEALRIKLKKDRKEYEEQNEKTKKAQEELTKTEMTDLENVNRLQQEQNKLRQEYRKIKDDPKSYEDDTRRKKLQEQWFTLEKERIELLRKMDDEAEKAHKEEMKRLEEKAKKEKAINKNRIEEKKLRLDLKDRNKRIDELQRAQDLEGSMSSVQEIADDPNSRGSQRAQRLLFLQDDTRRVLRQFGIAGADKKYLDANENEMRQLQQSLEKEGFLPTDEFEKAVEQATLTNTKLDQIIQEGITLNDK